MTWATMNATSPLTSSGKRTKKTPTRPSVAASAERPVTSMAPRTLPRPRRSAARAEVGGHRDPAAAVGRAGRDADADVLEGRVEEDRPVRRRGEPQRDDPRRRVAGPARGGGRPPPPPPPPPAPARGRGARGGPPAAR